MCAVQLTGHGDISKLVYREDVPTPQPGPAKCWSRSQRRVNNTDINTRIGWYSKSVTSDTNAGGAGGFDDVDTDDASWSGAPLVFPRIQGLIAAAILRGGCRCDESRIGERVLVRAMMNDPVTRPLSMLDHGF